MGVYLSSQRISSGDPILLRLQTGDGSTTKFPLAHVYNSAHVEVAGSPFSLVNIGNGLYANDSFIPGTIDHYDASYTVYSDAGHTIVDTTYNYDTDSFDVYILGTGGGGSVVYISAALTGLVQSSTLSGQVSETTLDGTISTVQLTGTVEDC